jgi:serine/threonine protein kinase
MPDGRVFASSQHSADDYEWGLNRFLDEAKALARFNHPNINQVLKLFRKNHTAYLVLDYVAGKSLSGFLQDGAIYQEQELIEFLSYILDGLNTIHKAGFVHSDIKPGNIIMRPDNKPVLIDLGAAQQTVKSNISVDAVSLTPRYAPVEQYSGKPEELGPFSDIYSLGIVLYRCMVGCSDRDIPESTMRQQHIQIGKEDPLARLEDAAFIDYSREFYNFVNWAIQPEVSMRPKSIEHWRSSLSSLKKLKQNVYEEALPDGFKVDRYKIVEVIGYDGECFAYHCNDILENVDKILFELYPVDLVERLDDYRVLISEKNFVDDFQNRKTWFLEQAHKLKHISNPYLIDVCDYFEFNKTSYYVANYIDGQTLQYQLENGANYPEWGLKNMIENIAEALCSLHGHGMLHNNINPSTIYITNDKAVLLCPASYRFGFDEATYYGNSQFDGHYGSVINNPYLITPEHAGERISTNMDIYSLVMVIYQCMTGIPGKFLPDYEERKKSIEQSGKDLLPLVIENTSLNYTKKFMKAVNSVLDIKQNFVQKKSISTKDWLKKVSPSYRFQYCAKSQDSRYS